jgi:hypothetical protein
VSAMKRNVLKKTNLENSEFKKQNRKISLEENGECRGIIIVF